jgi:hypothetical protein
LFVVLTSEWRANPGFPAAIVLAADDDDDVPINPSGHSKHTQTEYSHSHKIRIFISKISVPISVDVLNTLVERDMPSSA